MSRITIYLFIYITTLQVDSPGLETPSKHEIFPSPKRSDQLWSPPSLLYKAQRFFPRRKAARA